MTREQCVTLFVQWEKSGKIKLRCGAFLCVRLREGFHR
jgi:hypothetical protein